MSKIINGYKVLALFSDLTGGGKADWILAGNESKPPGYQWMVACVHRPDWQLGEPRWQWAKSFDTSTEARAAFMNRVRQYVPEHMSADPRFF
jgi:hypothetical protein